MKDFSSTFYKLFGIEIKPVSHIERITSAVGGSVAILGVFLLSYWLIGAESGLLVASMGATAVLLFAVPHGPLSQPWAVLGGHIISAIIGVSCAYIMGNEIIAASIAVGLAIGAMYYLRCIHPPGGATALSAVIGGDAVHALGYQFVLTPVLLNVLFMLSIAVLYNYYFAWRRYPVYLHQRKKASSTPPPSSMAYHDISHADFVYALSQIDSFVDVSEYDLLRIYDLATKQSLSRQFKVDDIVLGNYYSNGEYGDNWSVRHIIDEAPPQSDIAKDIVIYKVMAGYQRRSSGSMTRTEFARWAKYQVIRDEDNWKRVLSE
jgi:CBS-domain-containing membrane protein